MRYELVLMYNQLVLIVTLGKSETYKETIISWYSYEYDASNLVSMMRHTSSSESANVPAGVSPKSELSLVQNVQQRITSIIFNGLDWKR